MSDIKHVYSFSGGKDSTAMVLMSLERGLPVDEVVFFDTGWEFPQMYDHLELFEEKTGLKITRLKPKKPLDYYMLDHVITKGKHEGMKGYGFPWARGRYCTREKVEAIKKYQKEQGNYISYVGIAADEPNRFERNERNGVKMPLVEWGVTEKQALRFCEDRGFSWGGLYTHFRRVSCWLCPLQPKWMKFRVWKLFPDLKADYILRARTLEKSRQDAKKNFGDKYPEWCDKPVYAGYQETIDELLEDYDVWEARQNQKTLLDVL